MTDELIFLLFLKSGILTDCFSLAISLKLKEIKSRSQIFCKMFMYASIGNPGFFNSRISSLEGKSHGPVFSFSA